MSQEEAERAATRILVLRHPFGAAVNRFFSLTASLLLMACGSTDEGPFVSKPDENTPDEPGQPSLRRGVG
ncbi:MAG: hypothetical protein CME26_11060 [Gemmatimonadetes bacterium]|nr:hypothetical protein [Gemmatimonadota bacterium]